MAGPTTGKCHICKLSAEIEFCGLCGHWFCADCRTKWFDRSLEFVRVLIGGKAPGCCGPSLLPETGCTQTQDDTKRGKK